MSKAFTREDDDAGFSAPAASVAVPARVTALGAKMAREKRDAMMLAAKHGDAAHPIEMARLDALLLAPVSASNGGASVAFGARLELTSGRGKKRVIVLTSPDEVGLVPSAVSVAAPLARATLGAHVGDEIEVEGPRGVETWTLRKLTWT